MGYYFLNTTKKILGQLKNFSPVSMEGVASVLSYDPVNRLLRKQLFIYLLFFGVVTTSLTISGCAPAHRPYHSLTSSSLPYEKVTLSSKEREETTISDTPATFTYKTDSKPVATTPSAVPKPAGTVKLNGKRQVDLDEEIGESTLEAASLLYELAEESSKPIDVVIDSPGGSVSHGLYFIQAMKAVQAKGIVIRCVVPRFAASMAYTIFTQCSERYTLPYAQLLFHAPRISGTFLITPRTAVQLANGLAQVEKTLLNLIIPVMGVTAESGRWFAVSYHEERMFVAGELLAESPTPWFTIVNKIKFED